MSFLAPLFLLGAAAVALPVVFHLIRRSSRQRIPFSSLMFLQPTPPRVTRRSKLENVLLLLLRCAVIGLLAFAFARPYLSAPVAPDPAGRNGQKLLVLIDTSASMRRGTLWSAAKSKAQELFGAATSADQVACTVFDLTDRPLLTFEQWTAMPSGDRGALAAKRLDEASPTWGGTRLGPALIHACEMFDSAKDEQIAKKIVVVSDFQEGSRLDGLQGFEWPHGIQVTFEAVKASPPSNAGLQLAVERDEAAGSAGDGSVRVRVTNASDSKREQFKVGWRQPGKTDFAGATLDTYVPPGQSRIVTVPAPATPTEALGLTGDEYDFDNVVYVLPASVEQARVVYFGAETGDESKQGLYYLRRVFEQARRINVEVVAHDPAKSLDAKDLNGVPLLVVNSPLSEGLADVVRQAIQAKASALVVMKDVGMASTLRRLVGHEDVAVEEATGANYAMLGQIDFGHPLFAPFADPRYSDFTKIHFWKHRRVAVDKIPGARVIAHFDDNAAALTEVPVGKGKLWVIAASWQPAESQLALSSKFVPLLYAMLEQSGEGMGEARQYVVGDPVSVPGDAESVTIRKPDASEVKVGRGERFTGADQPGVYVVTTAQPPLRFTVNLAPEESRTGPLAFDELERMGVPIGHQLQTAPKQVQQRREHLQAAQLESRQKLWRWLIVAALVVLMIETWLAGRLTRRPVPQ